MRTLISLLFIGYQFILSAQYKNLSDIDSVWKQKQVTVLNLKYTSSLKLDSLLNDYSNLKQLDLSHSFIRSIHPDVKLESVTSLDVSHSFFNPWEIEQISKSFPNLTHLNLSNCRLHFLPNRLGKFEQLVSLDLSGNNLNRIPGELETFRHLKSLNLSNNRITFQSGVLGYLWQLEQLDLSNNPDLDLTNVLMTVSENRNLKELGIDGKLLSKRSSKQLGKLKIERLFLSGLPVQQQKLMKSIPTLKWLKIDKYKEGNLMQLLLKFANMRHMVLNKPALSEEMFRGLSIDTLTLNDACIQSDLFGSVKRLNVLDLSGCFISKGELQKIQLTLPKTTIIANVNEEFKFTEKNQDTPIVRVSSQRTRVHTEIPTVLNEKNATLEIPRNAFLTEKGAVYSGEVNIELKVYEDAVELALDGAPMNYTYNGNTELFGSNAMLYFSATTAEGERLLPNPDALINVEMRNNIPNTLGLMYQFDTVQQNWKELPDWGTSESNSIDLQSIIDSINGLDASSLVSVINNDRRYSLKVKTSRYDQAALIFESKFTPVKNRRNGNTIYYNRYSEEGAELCRHLWVIDTIVDDKTKKLLKKIQKETGKKYHKTTSGFYIPRIIWDISTEQDYERDNYRLKFNYRDSVISLPVALNKEKVHKTQRKHLILDKKLNRAKRNDRKYGLRFDKFYQKDIDRKAETLREERVEQVVRAMGNTGNTENVMFSMTLFGLINFDILVRERPLEYIAFRENIEDQYGKIHSLPGEFRIVNQAQNTYLNLRQNKIPVYRFSTVLVVFENNKLGILPLKAGMKKTIGKMNVFDINGMSSTEVARLIAQQNAQD